MDNQATKAIKEYLVMQRCKLHLVEPHNRQVNAAERAIQTFKNRFIGALGTTDNEFPVQIGPTSPRLHQPTATIADRSHQIGIRDPSRDGKKLS
jgi:hypothetical protein